MPAAIHDGQQAIASGIGKLSKGMLDGLDAIEKMRKEERDAARKGTILGAQNNYDAFMAKLDAEYNNRQDTDKWEEDYINRSNRYIDSILKNVPQEDRYDVELVLRNRQGDGHVRVIDKASGTARNLYDQSWTSAYKYAIESQNYDEAKRLVSERTDFTPEQKEFSNRSIKLTQDKDFYRNMTVDNPTRLYDLLNDGKLNDLFTPLEQENLRQKIRSGRDDVLRDGFYKSFVMEKASSSKKGEDTEPEYTGLFTEQEARWYRYKKAGRLNEVIDEINRAAAVEARAFNPNWNDIDMAVRKQQYIKRYEMLGLEKEFLNSQWSAAETERKNLKSKTIDTERILDRIQNTGLLIDKKEYDKAISTYVKDGKVDESLWEIDIKHPVNSGEMRKRFGQIAGIKDNLSARQARIAYENWKRKEISDNLRGRISEEFNAWRSTQEGIDASPVRQQEAMFSIARRLTGNQDLGLDNDAKNLDDAALQMEQLQENKFLQWVNSNKATIPASDVFGSMEKPQAVTLGFDAKQKDLPEGILLPKSMMEGFDKENGVVEATFDNKHYRRFRVVGTCEGDTPKMSYAIARKGYYDLRNTYQVNMSIRNGNTDALMKEQELKKKVKSTSSLIIGNEARRDKNGNLTVYKLPAGDGGGTHEIAGINNGSHPQEFSKLKEMLDSGKYQEAEDEAQRYIASYTKPVGDVLQSAGVQSSGIDYFLRDMYFNGGEYGVARVVHRALGIPDSRKFGQGTIQAIKEYLSSHSEGDLLNALRDSREGLYRSIAANNPEKRKFLQGWINRNNNAYGQASNMA
ncbi:putative peptidoglycan-binding domain-containing protein [Akkermansia sp. N21116]|uniref:putative peptidoglycan-binding domain-containing protein n=1 Tax=Akkermansia sp. N21116 TaxID=3040764 RepID=UPI00244EC6A6|nr:putative peptidoglycan-binding domain-containing protein [Akkermansia sp. N21116]WPX40499.1 putative peptidoglycan-binding domain-containing protein [Akkermansia sp. N21116]